MGRKIRGANSEKGFSGRIIRGGVFTEQVPGRGFQGAKSEEGFSGSKIGGGAFWEQNPRTGFLRTKSEEGLSASTIQGGVFGERKREQKSSCPRVDLNRRPLAYEAGTLPTTPYEQKDFGAKTLGYLFFM